MERNPFRNTGGHGRRLGGAFAVAALLMGTAAAQAPEGSDYYGELEFGGSVTRVAAAGGPPDNFTWHEYVVVLPAGLATVVVDVTANDDIDMALNFGSRIQNYDDADYVNDDIDTGPTFTMNNPPAGELWIDVLNLWSDRNISYTLTVTGTFAGGGGGAAGGSVGGRAGGVLGGIGQAPGTLSYPDPTPYGTIGHLELGQEVAGNLEQLPGDISESPYHTYTFTVPAGATEVVITLQPTDVLDVVVKYGSDILSYADQGEGGDWDYAAISETPGSAVVLSFSAPQAGTWYLDVVNWANQTADGRYSLRVEAR